MGTKYDRDLKIDKYNLDEELVCQPQLYLDWALKSVEALKEKDNAKKDLDLVRAEAEESIRKNPKKYGIIAKDKITETMIKTAIILHPEVKKYNLLYLKAIDHARVLEKVEKSFSDRKKSLDGLVQLDIRLYFSEPRTSVEHKDRIVEKTGRAIRRGLKRRR
jgi:hypothetical protein